jgi:hypothetical protein
MCTLSLPVSVSSCVGSGLATGESHGQEVIPTTSVVQWSEFLATDPEVPGSIPDATRFSEK